MPCVSPIPPFAVTGNVTGVIHGRTNARTGYEVTARTNTRQTPDKQKTSHQQAGEC